MNVHFWKDMGSKRVKQLPCEEMKYYKKTNTYDSRFHCSACNRV